MYEPYKAARNKAWDVLINCGISKLPVTLSDIVKYYNISTVRYSKYPNKHLDGDGFNTKINDKFIIFYNYTDYPITRQRFTVAHEIGHCLLEHTQEKINTFRYISENDKYKDIKEFQANVFARDILMPAIVLHNVKALTPQQIYSLCGVSITSAEIRAKRMEILEERNRYGLSHLEREVGVQFKDFINQSRIL